ncbi:cytochrome P450 [Phaeacidiphilus oryzae]|uniref:cytochrome P450 n=1 Tax=Phaeacidiphilus oryzae TaxID=348818 RepID=UPI000691F30E|nr:cytochrome P450 [Phaeacidiphilus oryzae]
MSTDQTEVVPRRTTPPEVSPPPSCPAHGSYAEVAKEGLPRLYGPVAEADPEGIYNHLREQYGSVAPVALNGDVPAWLVLGYREAMDVARTPTRFTRDARLWTDLLQGLLPSDSPLIPMVGWRPDAVSQDGPEHRRLRSALNDSINRFDRLGMRRFIRHYSEQLIDGFAGDGQADLAAQYAGYLPMMVMTRMVGLSEEYGPRLVQASSDMVSGTERALTANQFVGDTLTELVRERHHAPGYDLASWLIEHEAALNDDEVMNHLRLVMIAANETTTTLIANTLRMVLTDPRFRASLTGGLMTVPDAVEQVLWDEPPLQVCPARFATEDTELADRRIRAGDILLLGLAAGNTDPYIRPDPAKPMEGNRAHLAFSRGPHECPGQDIGRAITEIAVDTLLARLPDIRLAVPEEELSYTSSTWARHLDALPVRYAPTENQPRRPISSAAATAAAVSEALASSEEAVAAAAPAPVPPPAHSRMRAFWQRLKAWW